MPEQTTSKFVAFYTAVKGYALKAYAFSPYGFGLATGYFGHGLIQAAADGALFFVKTFLKF